MSSSSTDSPCVDSGNVTACTTSSVVTRTVVEATQVEEGAAGPTLKLRLVQKEKKCDKPDSKKKPEGRRGVSWTTDTVDNEHMNKKKSKSCCIYVKPKKFGESDTESSEDECPDHCGPHRKKQ